MLDNPDSNGTPNKDGSVGGQLGGQQEELISGEEKIQQMSELQPLDENKQKQAVEVSFALDLDWDWNLMSVCVCGGGGTIVE